MTMMTREHRAGSYIKGCRCPECRVANRERGRRHRREQRRAAGACIPCWFCDDAFLTEAGRALHDTVIHA